MKFARDTLTVQTSTIEKGEFNVWKIYRI
jgi:hypothetical protein